MCDSTLYTCIYLISLDCLMSLYVPMSVNQLYKHHKFKSIMYRSTLHACIDLISLDLPIVDVEISQKVRISLQMTCNKKQNIYKITKRKICYCQSVE